jgi:hypothetical protein
MSKFITAIYFSKWHLSIAILLFLGAQSSHLWHLYEAAAPFILLVPLFLVAQTQQTQVVDSNNEVANNIQSMY